MLTDLLRLLKRRPTSVADLAVQLEAAPREVRDVLVQAQADGVSVHCFGDLWSLERTPQLGGAAEPYKSRPDGSYVFGFIGDNHLCSKYSRLDVMADLYRRFREHGVDRVFNAGNWIDGEARFNKFDLLIHGMDAQVRYLVENYPSVPGIVTYAVAGDDHEGWYNQREGVDIGKYAERTFREAGRDDWVNLGYMEAFVPLQHAKTGATAQIHVIHPGGGSAYALSYTVQKLVEGYSGGDKPAVLLAGHYHKLEFCNVRNVWCVQTGCTQDQTPFMRKKKIQAHIGGGIMRLVQNPETGAIEQAGVDMFCYFNRGYYENNRWSMSGPVTLPPRLQPSHNPFADVKMQDSRMAKGSAPATILAAPSKSRNVTISCAFCKQERTFEKYEKQRFCSLQCASRFGHAKKGHYGGGIDGAAR